MPRKRVKRSVSLENIVSTENADTVADDSGIASPVAAETSSQKENENPPSVLKVGRIVSSSLFGTPFWHQMDEIEQKLSAELSPLTFPKSIAAVYNPLEYADELHSHYLAKFLDGPKKIVFIGMNPGPFGMCQTAV